MMGAPNPRWLKRPSAPIVMAAQACTTQDIARMTCAAIMRATVEEGIPATRERGPAVYSARLMPSAHAAADATARIPPTARARARRHSIMMRVFFAQKTTFPEMGRLIVK